MSKVRMTRPPADDEPLEYDSDAAERDQEAELETPAPIATVPPAAPAAELSDGADDGDGDADEADELGETHDATPSNVTPLASVRPADRRTQRAQRRIEKREARIEQPSASAILRDMAKREDEGLRDWIEGITAGQAAIRVTITREHPLVHEGIKCNGLLDSFDHPVDENFLKEHFGGGKLVLKILRKAADGSYKYLKSTTLDIAGDPKIENLKIRQGVAAPVESNKTSDAIVGRALDSLIEQGKRQQPAAGPDYQIVAQMMGPLKDQIGALTKLLEQRDRELASMRSQPRDPVQDKFVEKLMNEDNARLNTIKMAHEAELRTLREHAREDLNRERDRHQADRDYVIRSHEREVSNMKETHAREITSQKSAYESQIAILNMKDSVVTTVTNAEHKRLERENERMIKELSELRAKKDQSIGEKIREIKDLKGLVSDDSDDEEKSTLEKLIESPMAGKLIEKVGSIFGTEEKQAPQQQPQQFHPGQYPPGVPYRLPDGRLAMNRPDGKIVVQQPRMPAPPGATGTGAPGEIPLDPTDVKAAITFMEGAYRSNTDPKAFASSIRNMVPQPVLKQLAAVGVDDFLDKVAQLEATSPLAQQAGRLWARKVGKALVGGDDE